MDLSEAWSVDDANNKSLEVEPEPFIIWVLDLSNLMTEPQKIGSSSKIPKHVILTCAVTKSQHPIDHPVRVVFVIRQIL